MGIVRSVVACVVVLLVAGCRDEVTTRPTYDGGSCGPNERPRFGECVFICDRDSDCAAAERCNLFTGVCEPRPAIEDAGPQKYPCTTGATRCAADSKSVEYCAESGAWVADQVCEEDLPCVNGKCQICTPGAASCDPLNVGIVRVCLDDGTAERIVTCTGTATCDQDQCRECVPETTRCNSAGTSLETCKFTSDETRVWGWTPSGDGFDGSCITQQCLAGPPPVCKTPDCFPGAKRCADANTQEVCSSTGSWVQQPCSMFGATFDCQGQSCVDACTHAASQKSYFGCEYWTTSLDNGMNRFFKNMPAHSDLRQGTVDSDYALVVSNQSTQPTAVQVHRWIGGAETLVKSVTIPGKDDPATKGVLVIKLPWQSIAHTSVPNVNHGVTGQARFAYRLMSDRPVTVYQFNPLDAVRITKTCTGTEGEPNSSCNELPNYSGGIFGDPNTWGICKTGSTGKRCHYYTYSNDASLLLPKHGLGTSYVVVSQEHSTVAADFLNPERQINGSMTIIAPENGTTVTVKSSAQTQGSPSGYTPSVAGLSKNQTQTYTLNRYEVLQITTGAAGTNLECSGSLCRRDNDLTGTVVTSSKPVAVFGGASCSLRPYNQGYCDHLEEQIFPFETWGKTLVAQKSHPFRLFNGSFATMAQSSPDHYKVVASCPTSNPACSNGTLISLIPLPSDLQVLAPNRCISGTINGNNCRLAGGGFMEFRTKQNFTVTGSQPIALAQFFPGRSTVSNAETGDPSLVLLPPAEQWRKDYAVLTAPGIRDNYLGLVIDTTRTGSVEVDGAAVTGFTQIGSTSYAAKNHPVNVGVHTITALPAAGATKEPTVGVIVFGFDTDVSYGYAGGLDLGSIVSGIDPGG